MRKATGILFPDGGFSGLGLKVGLFLLESLWAWDVAEAAEIWLSAQNKVACIKLSFITVCRIFVLFIVIVSFPSAIFRRAAVGSNDNNHQFSANSCRGGQQGGFH
jgi:hypothetical protein